MNIRRLYGELLFSSIMLNLLDAILSAGAVFAVGFFLVYFYRISILFALIPAVIGFFISLVRKLRKNKILLLEKSYPALKERLRTSYDYKAKSNSIIDELHSDIADFMRKVDIGAFLSNKELMIRLFLIYFLMTGTLYLSSLGFDFTDIKNAVENSGMYKKAREFTMSIMDDTREEVKNRQLLDKPNLAPEGTRDLNVTIDTYDTELNMNEISDPDKNDFGGAYPEEIAGAAQETYQEEIPEEDKETVKEYFKQINK